MLEPFEVTKEDLDDLYPAVESIAGACSNLGIDFFRDGPQVHVASLAGVAVLKLVAWNEQPGERGQDPIDLCTIMKYYDEVVALYLYDKHEDVPDDDFDTRYAHARILGRDIAPLLHSDKLRNAVLSVLDANLADAYDSPLADAVGRDCYRKGTYASGALNRCGAVFLSVWRSDYRASSVGFSGKYSYAFPGGRAER